jgi:flagellar hook-associated protein 1 FlgK
MSGLNGIMDGSLSALLAAQLGMATTGHNISNAGTEGYSRQDVVFAARRPSVLGYAGIGQGVEVMGIRRIQDSLLVGNLRNQMAQLGSYQASDRTLQDIEGLLGSVDNDHLGGALTQFFSAWNSLAQPPFNASLKVGVVQTAGTLVEDFRSMDAALRDMERDIAQSAAAEIQTLNHLLQELGNLNGKIMTLEAGGNQANDLRDQRDMIVNHISYIAEVTVTERPDGSQDLIMAGRTLVSRDRVTQFEGLTTPSAAGGQLDVVTAGNQQQVSLAPGTLEGLLNASMTHVRNLRSKLDGVVQNLVSQVNEHHRRGPDGLAFFTGSTLADIAVNEAIVRDENLVATGLTRASGDNELALAIAALDGNAPGRVSVGESYRSVITEVAGDRGRVDFLLESQEGVVMSLEARIASVSGVSLDEEGARLVQYQNSYSAAAKVIQTVQEMYESLLSMI